MARTEETAGSQDGEAHRFLVVVADTYRFRLARADPPHTRMRRDEKRPVLRVDPQAVNMNRPRVLSSNRGELLVRATASGNCGREQSQGCPQA
jgi:hypothetical protein